jgi:hypothetical protein
MDASSFLRADHESVLGMIESLERGRGTSETEVRNREHLATSLVIAASQHEAVEEQFFWPAVRKSLPEGDELADHGLEQEESGKQLHQQIEDSEAGSPEFEQALTDFLVAMRERIDYEQNEVWPRFAEVEPAADMAALGDRMAAAKKKAPTRPPSEDPVRPGSPEDRRVGGRGHGQTPRYGRWTEIGRTGRPAHSVNSRRPPAPPAAVGTVVAGRFGPVTAPAGRRLPRPRGRGRILFMITV